MKRLPVFLPLSCVVLFVAFIGATRPASGDGASPPGRPETGSAAPDKLVYADFEAAKDNRPVSSRGGPVQLFSYHESTPCRFKGAGA